ncbi:hypothetical protein BG006_000691 [Podila minutissima]|uniref:Uncharacterized protein n=1 Tax=Podila minutissima TaxID=64525 RepID=A0A9P5SBL6_9FUNG|nr:hypothetical protein BG006_000691 [Podila minutissima]
MAEIGQPGHIDRLTDDGKYRLGACIFIPQGLNFAKELLTDFKTSELFQGTDLENCRKGIEMLRDLMIKTAEKMRPRLPKLLEEHSDLIAGIEDSDTPIHFEKERNGLIVNPDHIHARPQGEKGESTRRSQARTLLAEDDNSQERAHKKFKSGLHITKVLQSSMKANSMQQTTRSAAVVRQPLVSFLFPRGKENQPPRLS